MICLPNHHIDPRIVESEKLGEPKQNLSIRSTTIHISEHLHRPAAGINLVRRSIPEVPVSMTLSRWYVNCFFLKYHVIETEWSSS